MLLLNELMIGNYFLDASTGEIDRVKEIKYDGVIYGTVNGIDITKLQPVPLDESWLFYFGFKLKDINYYELKYFSIEKKDYSKEDKKDILFIDSQYSMIIDTVHYLQNLFLIFNGSRLNKIK